MNRSIHIFKIGQFVVSVYSCDTIDNHIVECEAPEDDDPEDRRYHELWYHMYGYTPLCKERVVDYPDSSSWAK